MNDQNFSPENWSSDDGVPVKQIINFTPIACSGFEIAKFQKVLNAMIVEGWTYNVPIQTAISDDGKEIIASSSVEIYWGNIPKTKEEYQKRFLEVWELF